MPEPAPSQQIRRFRQMSDEALKEKLAWHQKYAAIIEMVLAERKKEEQR
jgi:hypothetical protein